MLRYSVSPTRLRTRAVFFFFFFTHPAHACDMRGPPGVQKDCLGWTGTPAIGYVVILVGVYLGLRFVIELVQFWMVHRSWRSVLFSTPASACSGEAICRELAAAIRRDVTRCTLPRAPPSAAGSLLSGNVYWRERAIFYCAHHLRLSRQGNL